MNVLKLIDKHFFGFIPRFLLIGVAGCGAQLAAMFLIEALIFLDGVNPPGPFDEKLTLNMLGGIPLWLLLVSAGGLAMGLALCRHGEVSASFRSGRGFIPFPSAHFSAAVVAVGFGTCFLFFPLRHLILSHSH